MGILDKFRKERQDSDWTVIHPASEKNVIAYGEYKNSKILDAMFKLRNFSEYHIRTNSWWYDFLDGIEEAESMVLKGVATKKQDDFRKEAIKKIPEIMVTTSEYDYTVGEIPEYMLEALKKNPHLNTKELGIPDAPIINYTMKKFFNFFHLTKYMVDSRFVSVHLQKLGIKKVSDLFWNKTKSSESNLPKYLDSFVNKYPNLLNISKGWTESNINSEQYFLDSMKLYDLIINENIIMSIPMFVRLLASRYFEKEWKEFEDSILHENPKKIEDFIKAFMMYHYDSWEERLDDFKTVLKQSKMPIEGIESMIHDFQRNIKRESFKESLLSGDSGTKISDLDVLGGIEFENFLQHLFKKMGYQCEVTKGSGDHGADLLIKRMGKLTVVQAKRHVGKVSNSAIQEAAAAVKPYNADNAMVITTNYFTKGAAFLADSNNVKLIDRNKLEEWLKQYQI